MDFNFKALPTEHLLQYYNQIMQELRDRKILRTSNGPVGDYAEWLIAQKLNLILEGNSTAGYDAIDTSGMKYQIKGRRVTALNKSTQLSAIRNLELKEFDFLIAILFNESFEPALVLKIPHEVIEKYASFSEHVHAHRLLIRENIKNDSLVTNITSLFVE